MKRTLQIFVLLAVTSPLVMAQTIMNQSGAHWGSVVVAATAPAMYAQTISVSVGLDYLGMSATDGSRLTVFPNPAVGNPQARFELERSQRVVIDVFDLLGRRVSQQELGIRGVGEHEVTLGLSDLPTGLYIVRLTGDAGARATVRITRSVSA